MVMASKYRLKEFKSVQQGLYDQEGSKELIHENKLIARDYVEMRNSEENNELYVIDEDATKAYLKQREENVKENEEKAKRASVSQDDILKALIEDKAEQKSKKETRGRKPKED